MTIKLLLVGNGAWGKNYVSTLSSFSDIKLNIANRSNWKELVDANPHGVIVCTGPISHIEIAKYVLEKKIPLIIEKPVALSSQELKELLPFEHNAPILVNYTHLFSDNFLEFKNKSDINTIMTNFSGVGPFREYSSLFDYGSHPVAMCLYLLNEYPTQINAIKINPNDGDLFYIDLKFSNSMAHITTGNGSAYKSSRMSIRYENDKTFVYDDIIIRKDTLPLTNAIKCFLNLIAGQKDDRAGLNLTIKAVQILEECHKQMSEIK